HRAGKTTQARYPVGRLLRLKGGLFLMTNTLSADIEVGVPIRVAYDQWTQFEEFPRFMAHVESVEQHGEALTKWLVSVGGVRRAFIAAIVDQQPDDHIAWASLDGPAHAGQVRF